MCSFQYVYTLVESVCDTEGHTYKSYGICVINKETNEALTYYDVSLDKGEIERLAMLCNELKLDPIHIEDVIEDLIAS